MFVYIKRYITKAYFLVQFVKKTVHMLYKNRSGNSGDSSLVEH